MYNEKHSLLARIMNCCDEIINAANKTLEWERGSSFLVRPILVCRVVLCCSFSFDALLSSVFNNNSNIFIFFFGGNSLKCSATKMSSNELSIVSRIISPKFAFLTMRAIRSILNGWRGAIINVKLFSHHINHLTIRKMIFGCKTTYL